MLTKHDQQCRCVTMAMHLSVFEVRVLTEHYTNTVTHCVALHGRPCYPQLKQDRLNWL